RGPDFFESRVTDDPREKSEIRSQKSEVGSQENVLYDPQQERPIHFQHLAWMNETFSPGLFALGSQNALVLASAQQKEPGKKEPGKEEKPGPGKDGSINAPRLPVN